MGRQSYVGLSHLSISSLKLLSQGNTPDAAKDIAAFVAIFFEHFSQFKGRGFHMAGESYGVHLYRTTTEGYFAHYTFFRAGISLYLQQKSTTKMRSSLKLV